MPIRRDLLALYPPDWRELSDHVRFVRASGRCEACRRPHGQSVTCLPDGRWCDAGNRVWITALGLPTRRPANVELLRARVTNVVLSTAHLDHDPTNRDEANLAAWCQRCHLAYDLPHHRLQRWLRYRSRWASADLFLGPYALSRYPLNS